MTRSGLITVVIPAYNAESFIAKSIMSAHGQPEVGEILVVNDGSTDATLEVCRNLEKQYPKLSILQHDGGVNKGIGASRNLAITHASCKYISLLDADDYYLDGRFALDLEILENNNNVDGIYNAIGTEFYDEEGSARYHARGLTEDSLTTVRIELPPESLFENMAPIGNKGYFMGDGLTIRKDVFSKIGLFDETLEAAEDTLLWLKMALKCRLVPGILDTPVAIRGVHRNNTTADQNKVFSSQVIMYKKLYHWAKMEQIDLKYRERIWKHLYYSSLKYGETNTITTYIDLFRNYPVEFSQLLVNRFSKIVAKDL